MTTNNPYTAGQLDLIRRIEMTTHSSELRKEIRAMRSERSTTSRRNDEVVQGKKQATGFRPNEENRK